MFFGFETVKKSKSCDDPSVCQHNPSDVMTTLNRNDDGVQGTSLDVRRQVNEVMSSRDVSLINHFFHCCQFLYFCLFCPFGAFADFSVLPIL